MNTDTPIIKIQQLARRYGKLDAVHGLSLAVRPGRCYGFFGRNGAGKTTTIKCLLNLLRPDSGTVRVFGLDPGKDEVAIKSRLAYVPDFVAFYPWMTVSQTLEYLASFRKHWNRDIEADLLKRFQLDPNQKAGNLSKGQKTQVALIGAICPEPELLVLDEPTSGLDPIVRREFIETVIGAYQSSDPGRRTVFVSTHLISEFEGLIDEFTIIEQGRELITMEADAARDRFRKIRVRFTQPPPNLVLPGVLSQKANGRELEILANGNSAQLLEKLKAFSPEELRCESLSLEEIFVASDIIKKEQRMTPLIKKEIRLLLPAGIVAILLALPPICTRADDPTPIFLMFLGMAMLALNSIGRETSLNTFSSLLALPAERIQIWRVKLSVLSIAFLIVFAVWRLAILFSFKDYGGFPVDPEAAEDVLIAGCFVTVATFTGGLWSALLLRQLAGAFWLTLLVPGVLAGITAGFASLGDSSYAVIAALGTLMIVYSIGGFLFARWLFFHAQDIGWTGGIITLSGWTFAATSGSTNSPRVRKPFLALLKKEFQLQHASLVGASGLFVMHIGIIIFRHVHKFARESTGDTLTSVFWMVWLVFPVLVSCMAIAEERRLGVMDAQLCLPCTRRRQFIVKWCVTLFLGIFFGSVLPVLLEYIGGSHVLSSADNSATLKDAREMLLLLAGLALWLIVAGFFASSLARNFLQAVGYACATVVVWTILLGTLLDGRMVPFDHLPPQPLLTAIIAGPVVLLTLLWLAWLNFKHFHENWHLWRRNALGVVSAFVCISVASPAIYNRVWEKLMPDEPAHAPARMSLARPPMIQEFYWMDALVQLPDGRVWFGKQLWPGDSLWQRLLNPCTSTITESRALAGSNWVSVVAAREDFKLSAENNDAQAVTNPDDHVTGYLDVVAIRNDGTLWISDASREGNWMGDHMGRYGNDTNWQQVVHSRAGVMLLKNDGTLWRWGTNRFDWTNWRHAWPTLHDYQPCQIGTDSDWKEIEFPNSLAAKSDGSVWRIRINDKTGEDTAYNNPDLNGAPLKTLCLGGNEMSYVRPDGTLWARWTDGRQEEKHDTGFFQVGNGTNWVATTITWSRLSALKSDGTIWVWNIWDTGYNRMKSALQKPPTRLGIHSDWVAITRDNSDLVTLAADGSLWLWPAREMYEDQTLLKLPKQPRYLANIFVGSN